jgi:hypothetical protein
MMGVKDVTVVRILGIVCVTVSALLGWAQHERDQARELAIAEHELAETWKRTAAQAIDAATRWHDLYFYTNKVSTHACGRDV